MARDFSEPRDISPKTPINDPSHLSASSHLSRKRGNIPINRNQQLIPPTNSLRQIRPSPNDPRSPPFNLLPPSTLHNSLQAPHISHNAHIPKRKTLALNITLIKSLSKPFRFLIRNLGRSGQSSSLHDRHITESEYILDCCSGSGIVAVAGDELDAEFVVDH